MPELGSIHPSADATNRAPAEGLNVEQMTADRQDAAVMRRIAEGLSAARSIVQEEQERGDPKTPLDTRTAIRCTADTVGEAEIDTSWNGRRESLVRALGWALVALKLHDEELVERLGSVTIDRTAIEQHPLVAHAIETLGAKLEAVRPPDWRRAPTDDGGAFVRIGERNGHGMVQVIYPDGACNTWAREEDVEQWPKVTDPDAIAQGLREATRFRETPYEGPVLVRDGRTNELTFIGKPGAAPEPIGVWDPKTCSITTTDVGGWTVKLAERKVVVVAPAGFDREHFEEAVFVGFRCAGASSSAAYPSVVNPPGEENRAYYFAFFGPDERSAARLLADVRRELGRAIDFDRRVLAALGIVLEGKAAVSTRAVLDFLADEGCGADLGELLGKKDAAALYRVEEALRRVTGQTGVGGVWKAPVKVVGMDLAVEGGDVTVRFELENGRVTLGPLEPISSSKG